jgi:mannose-1-phosphate guanylyltransferase
MTRTGPPGRTVTPVILSGGAGTRLWPLSRPDRPKQMLALAGPESLLAMTARRVADRTRFETPVLVTGQSLAEAAVDQLEAAGVRPGLVIVEPQARNTAPAIALAALAIGGDALLLVMPSDHLIADNEAFLDAIELAVPIAERGWLVTFGITPHRAEIGYGYILRGEELTTGVHAVRSFVEKPDIVRAESFIADGRYSWNAGIFLFRADSFLEAVALHAPAIESAARAAIEQARLEGGRLDPAADDFSLAPAQPVDRAVMERADKVAVVPVDMRWSDIGSWQALYEASEKDAAGNAVEGDAMLLDASNCLVRTEGHKIVAIGVEGLAIVAAGDALLIVPRDQSQRVQEAVSRLASRGED